MTRARIDERNKRLAVYLKTFYPQRFTVEEAFYASAVELVKVLVIALPFLLLISVSLYLLRHFDKKS